MSVPVKELRVIYSYYINIATTAYINKEVLMVIFED